MLGVLILITAQQSNKADRQKMTGFIILSISAVVFWTLYQLAPMGLNLFIERNVDRHVFGWTIAPQWVQNINTLVIIFGGPILSIVFSNLRDKGINISIPIQFSVALLLIGIAFAILPMAIHFANAEGFVSFYWVAISYILQSMGELFISPIGYAMIGQLAPVPLRGVLMGTWMMIIGVSAILSDHFSKLALGTNFSTSPLSTNESYSHIFNLLGWTAILAAFILLALVPILNRLTQEKKF